MTKVFVSHSHKDNNIVTTFVNDLRDAGVSVWVDLQEISVGFFMDRINIGLRESDWFVIVITNNSLVSEPVKTEMSAGQGLVWAKKMRAVIPFIGSDYDTNLMEPLWQALHRYDSVKDGYSRAFKGLLGAIGHPIVEPLSLRVLKHDVKGIPEAEWKDVPLAQTTSMPVEDPMISQIEQAMHALHAPPAVPARPSAPDLDTEISQQLHRLFDADGH